MGWLEVGVGLVSRLKDHDPCLGSFFSLFLTTVLPVGFGQPEREIEDISCFYEIKSFFIPFFVFNTCRFVAQNIFRFVAKKNTFRFIKTNKKIV